MKNKKLIYEIMLYKKMKAHSTAAEEKI
jgi:hypothetical protein